MRGNGGSRSSSKPSTLGMKPLIPQPVEKLDERRVARRERLALGRADPAEHVPVRTARRQRQRPTRRVPVQAALRVELVEKRKEVVLVGAATVQQDERARRLPGCRTLP